MTSIPPPAQAGEQPPDLDPRHREPAPQPAAPTFGPEAWGAWMAPAAIVTGIGVGIVLDVIIGVFAGTNRISHPGPVLNFALNAIFDLAFVGAALYYARQVARPHPADFGYVRPKLGRAAGLIVGGAIAYYVVTFVYQQLLDLHATDKLPSAFGSVRTSTLAMLCAAGFVCVVAPIAEEFFFRGFLFGVLRRWRGPWVAAVLTSILFGAVHAGSAPIEDLIPLGFFGFVLCMVRWRTGSIYPGMALHSLNNGLALGITDLKWQAGSVLLLIAVSVAVIAALTFPLSAVAQRPSPA